MAEEPFAQKGTSGLASAALPETDQLVSSLKMELPSPNPAQQVERMDEGNCSLCLLSPPHKSRRPEREREREKPGQARGQQER